MSQLLDYIFPKKCFGCGRIGRYLCHPCRQKIKSLPVNHHPKLQLDGCLSLFKYRRAIRKAIFELKYSFVTNLVPEISGFCVETVKNEYPVLLNYWQENKFVVVPIPLYWQKQNWRGFNQSELLASSIAKGLGLDFDNNILLKVKNTAPQVKQAGKKERIDNVSGSFKASKNIHHQNIILFDDVLTTGSTLKAAVKAIKPGSRIRCWGLTLAG